MRSRSSYAVGLYPFRREFDGGGLAKKCLECRSDLREALRVTGRHDTVVPLHPIAECSTTKIGTADKCDTLVVRLRKNVSLWVERSRERGVLDRSRACLVDTPFEPTRIGAFQIEDAEQRIRIGGVAVVAGENPKVPIPIEQIF